MFFIYVQKQAMFEKTMSQTCRMTTTLEEKGYISQNSEGIIHYQL